MYKGNTRIRLQQHPFTVLLVLLERPGDLVTRAEIRSRVWPNGTVVEFDHSINTAVNKLRSALSDKAEKPRYIETVARKGYRFVAPVERSTTPEIKPLVEPIEPQELVPGTVVTHYEIERLAGIGANGRVYQALDLRLNRRAALKFLTEAYASDDAALKRFQREARALSALDHPNICGVYEFGQHARTPFLAMQWLEGETLEHRIHTHGALDLDTLLRVAIQTAKGLEAAHCRGVIHRDVKPANIFLTSTGQVKLLDFGIAKLDDEREVSTALVPEVTESGVETTRIGVVMGTSGYMSPEQSRGEPVDSRTDIFSFGLVLYEMATGHRPSQSGSKPILPPRLEAVMDGALQQDRNLRTPSFAVLCKALEEPQPKFVLDIFPDEASACRFSCDNRARGLGAGFSPSFPATKFVGYASH